MKKLLSIIAMLALCLLFSGALAAETGGSWTTTNPAVVIVDGEGNVTAVGVGEADVYFTDADGNVTMTHVTVTDLNCPHCGEYVDESNSSDHAPCMSCGMFACQEGYDGLDHETIINQFCDREPQHRACASYREHHCEHCGRDYDCSLSGSHTTCKMCKLPWCDKTTRGNHKTPDCGNSDHRPCMLGSKYDEDDHEWCRYCKKYKCKTSSKIKHGDDEGECGYKEPEVKCSGCGEAGVQHTEKCDVCGTLICDPNWSHNNTCDHCYKNSDAGKHAKCACGDTYLCWEMEGHGASGCAAPIICGGCEQEVDSEDEHLLSCGHYSCRGGEHSECAHCGKPACNGDSHGTSEGQCGYVPPRCNFCQQEGEQHATAACGNHCVNQSGEHTRCETDGAGCGGWLCSGDHSRRRCEHCVQLGGTHEECGHCGDWICYTPNVSHGTGEGQCSYVPPITCEAGCGATVGNASDHKLSCGHYSCQGGEHGKLGCGHYACEGGEHGECAHCGKPVCNGNSHGTGEGQCGYVPPKCSFCGETGDQHATAACGNHCVNESGEHERCSGETGCGGWRCNGKNHDGRSCDHCSQVGGDHSWCSICDNGNVCWGSHGDGVCNAQ